MFQNLAFLSVLHLTIGAGWVANAACLNVQQTASLTFEGTLTYRIFAGPPNYDDVRKGDAPEPTYVLKLDAPICATGDEFVDPRRQLDRIQIIAEGSGPAAQSLWREIRRLVGQRVLVEGRSAFGAHTGHHHAPLLLPITAITIVRDPTLSYGTAMTTVQAFYLALAAGNGEEAARFVIPGKRSSGPLSAAAITNFYGSLIEPLTLVDIRAVRSDEYRVRYHYLMAGPRRCDGAALVRTTKINGLNLIETIRALNGC